MENEQEVKKGRIVHHLQDMSVKKIEVDLDLSEIQIAWQFDRLYVWWNAEDITKWVIDIEFKCDKKRTKKSAILTVYANLLIPRNYHEL